MGGTLLSSYVPLKNAPELTSPASSMMSRELKGGLGHKIIVPLLVYVRIQSVLTRCLNKILVQLDGDGLLQR